ncbi:MAG TPA: xanthine dehydrogenase family protein subunit M [Firmicutes bacterium]|jgi:CO/xanthine dehydrogenase FAD-binding subunit|nr:xanthine dehydrogenase family protein subunit M [Bacillota bacterium]
MAILNTFHFHKPVSLKEAVELHENYGPQASYIAGGTDVIVGLKKNKLEPGHLISLLNIPGLNHISSDGKELHIGALTTHRQLEMNEEIGQKFSVLHDAVKQIGSVQIRNVATLGGNLCSALPSADSASPLLVLNAKIKTAGVKNRILAINDFFVGPGQSALEPSEIVTEIIIPYPHQRSGAAYVKLGRRGAMEIPLIGAAVYFEVDELGFCTKARVALTTAAPTPIRVPNAEAALEGKKLNQDVFRSCAERALLDASPRTSWRTTAEHRRAVIPVLVERACAISLARIEQSS